MEDLVGADPVLALQQIKKLARMLFDPDRLFIIPVVKNPVKEALFLFHFLASKSVQEILGKLKLGEGVVLELSEVARNGWG